jgi:hypothetical protein
MRTRLVALALSCAALPLPVFAAQPPASLVLAITLDKAVMAAPSVKAEYERQRSILERVDREHPIGSEADWKARNAARESANAAVAKVIESSGRRQLDEAIAAVASSRGALMVIDRQAAIALPPTLDITNEVVSELAKPADRRKSAQLPASAPTPLVVIDWISIGQTCGIIAEAKAEADRAVAVRLSALERDAKALDSMSGSQRAALERSLGERLEALKKEGQGVMDDIIARKLNTPIESIISSAVAAGGKGDPAYILGKPVWAARSVDLSDRAAGALCRSERMRPIVAERAGARAIVGANREALRKTAETILAADPDDLERAFSKKVADAQANLDRHKDDMARRIASGELSKGDGAACTACAKLQELKRRKGFANEESMMISIMRAGELTHEAAVAEASARGAVIIDSSKFAIQGVDATEQIVERMIEASNRRK